MKHILSRIDEYINVKEKNDSIILSLNKCKDLETAIELFKKSSDKEGVFELFNDDIKEEIKQLIDGGILD